MGYIKGHDRNQIILFPETINDYISEDNSVRIIDEYVNQLDLEKYGFKRTTPSRIGRPPYNPKDLLKLYIYGYLNRVRSSRRLEHEATRNLEVIWLLNKLKPDFKTIADFRKDNKKALLEVFRGFTRLCNEWDLFGKEIVAIDGSKFRACNSKKNNYNKKKLERHLKYIDEKINKYLQELDESDENETFDRKPDTEEIRQRIKELKDRKQKYENYQKELEETGQSEISTTDPDARLMTTNNKNSVEMNYNAQTAVDSRHKLLIDFKITNSPNDLGELADMALRAKNVFGGADFEALADKGYYKAEDLKKCVDHGITPYVARQTYSNSSGNREFYPDKFIYDKDKDVYICPMGEELTRGRQRKSKGQIIGFDYRNYGACSRCACKEQCTKSVRGRTIFRHVDQDFLDGINLQTALNMEKYRQRQMIVEHPFGTIKRNWGAYYFLTKGKLSVTTEAALTFLAYNMKRVMNILGNKEMLRRLREKREAVTV